MQIAICDGKESRLDFLESLVSEWADERRESCRVSCFASAQAFWLSYAKGRFDILLLDDRISGQDGGKLARELRRRQDAVRILFFVAGESGQGGVGEDAGRCLLKPVGRGELFSALDEALGRAQGQGEGRVVLRCGGETLTFREEKILYIEAFSHSSMFCTGDGDFSVPLGLGEVCRRLSRDKFVRVHRSYAVNLQAVRGLRRYELSLDGGRCVPVSRGLFTEVSEALARRSEAEA